jgi:hypothetical protein
MNVVVFRKFGRWTPEDSARAIEGYPTAMMRAEKVRNVFIALRVVSPFAPLVPTVTEHRKHLLYNN